MSIENSFGKTIELFLVDGKSSGLRKTTMHGGGGLLFLSNASALGDLIESPNFVR